ncbi:NADH:flavin oxidoreductase [Namhaeicola litoreus]|uniref:NADH:flavin oxidoreductase n=1 Tax=Namhaeicola litoreus TaxID=1052145 RepID=A0ABW3XZZ5_9FLAO
MNHSPDTPLRFQCGQIMKNRFMLAPMTNQQSYEDGRLSEEEFHWLTMRARGQFGLVMTCASHVQEIGKGFSGQLGIFSDDHLEGHQRLTNKIKEYGSLALIQLHHAGMRSTSELIGQAPVCPSANEKTGARALRLEEVKQLRDDFIRAATRAKKSGYDGVEVHGAHGYILSQFISAEINHRTDEYGGSLGNRARLLFEIVDGIREACGKDFLLGVRLSPEKFGMELSEIKTLCLQFAEEAKIDFLDISLWDFFKRPEDEQYQNQTLLEHFTGLDLKDVKLTVAGKIRNGQDVKQILDVGVDFVSIGRSAILHHDFPVKVIENPDFKSIETPVSKHYLLKEGLSDSFITYMGRWPDFVEASSV